MIKSSFLKKQFDRTRTEQKTSPFLVRFVLFAADRVLQERYGQERPQKALQTSVAVKAMLMSLGIHSRIFAGALCYPEIYRDDATIFKWSGFWDTERHFWAITEHNEFVDLTLPTLHAHPGMERADVIAAPALWWSIREKWPPFLRYLPEGPVRIDLPRAEMRDLDELRADVAAAKERFIEGLELEDVQYSPVMTGPASIDELAAAGELWVDRARRAVGDEPKFPDWIVEREKAIEEQAKRHKDSGRR